MLPDKYHNLEKLHAVVTAVRAYLKVKNTNDSGLAEFRRLKAALKDLDGADVEYCEFCGVTLDNVETGLVIAVRKSNREQINVCANCLVENANQIVEIARAKGIVS